MSRAQPQAEAERECEECGMEPPAHTVTCSQFDDTENDTAHDAQAED